MEGGAQTKARPPADFWLRGACFFLDAYFAGANAALAAALLHLAGLGSAPVTVAALSVLAAYYACLPVRLDGQTPGKLAGGLGVERLDGSAPGPARSAFRAGACLLSALPLGAGFLPALLPGKLALHDLLCGTRVVKLDAPGPARRTLVLVLGFSPAFVLCAFFIAPLFTKRTVEPVETFDARRKLGAIRRALAAHRAGPGAKFPPTLSSLVPRYAREIPELRAAGHLPTREMEPLPSDACRPGEKGPELIGDRLKDSGRWGYFAEPASPCRGLVVIDCTHTDSSGARWHSY